MSPKLRYKDQKINKTVLFKNLTNKSSQVEYEIITATKTNSHYKFNQMYV